MSEPVRNWQAASGGEDRTGGAGLCLGACGAAEFTIDPQRGTLEAANTPALSLLRLPRNIPLPLPLDTAMPAMRRLREIDAGAPSEHGEELKLWCAGSLVRLSAKVFKDSTGDGRSRLVVRALQSDLAVSRETSPPPASTTGSDAAIASENEQVMIAGEASSTPVPRSDEDTLREIGRRIREGYKPLPQTLDMPAPPEQMDEPALSVSSETFSDVKDPPRASVAEPPEFQGTPLPPRQPAAPPDGRSLSKVAHELKTPLSAIVAAAEIMRDQQLGPMGNTKYLGYAGDIYESARHALDVINAMLTGTARESRNITPVDLSELATATASVMQPLARSSGINLETDCRDEPLEVTGDATAIRQIIYNLISNALKFTPAGGDVRVVTGYLPKGVPFLVVRDTGEGMSEDDIVSAFYRDDTHIGARKGGGYGIGLPMVRRLAEMMSATIDVDSEPGKGTAVLVSFPNR